MNGYPYNGAYNGDKLGRGVESSHSTVPAMGTDRVGPMMGGQSLDEIVNQNAKTIRRQSMSQSYGDVVGGDMDSEMRQMPMMDYGVVSNLEFDATSPMHQGGITPGDGTKMARHQQPRALDGGQSQDLGLNTSYGNSALDFGTMASSNTGYNPSPTRHQQNPMGMCTNSQYFDPGLGMRMNYELDSGLGSTVGEGVQQVNLYGQPQYTSTMLSSPVHQAEIHGITDQASGIVSQDSSRSANRANSRYRRTSISKVSPVRHLSKSQSLHLPPAASSSRSAGATPMSQPATRGPTNNVFQGQPQYLEPGSQQDGGLGNARGQFDGGNGPLPIDTGRYNPKNQSFKWQASEDGWPSKKVDVPPIHTPYKQAHYSASGFDMLAVLV